MKQIKTASGAIKAKELNSSFSQAIGLMFQKPKPVLMNFKKERKNLGVHMLFCFWPLDLVFMDKNKKIVELKQDLKPFCFYNAKQPTQYLLELPNGSIKKHKIKVQRKLKFE